MAARGGLAGHNDLILKIFQLAHAAGIVLLHVAVLDGVKLLTDGLIGLIHLLIGQRAALTHQDHIPLPLGNLIELFAQVLLQVGVVNALQHIHALLQGQYLEVALPHPPLHVFKGDAAHRVRDIAGVDQIPGLRVCGRSRIRTCGGTSL